MDLSQVMLKLHGGKYDDPDEFGADIKLIFDNWKLYCKDPKRHYQVKVICNLESKLLQWNRRILYKGMHKNS